MKKIIVKEIYEPIKLWRHSIYLAFINLQQSHIRSKLGLFWEPLSSLFVAVVLSIIWSQVFNISFSSEYFLYVYSGITIWMVLLAPIIRDGSSCLTSKLKTMRSTNFPIIYYVYNYVTKAILSFLVSSFLVIIINGVLSEFHFSSILWITLSLILVFLTSVGILLFLGIIVLFAGDVKELITSIMRLGFLSTPILWTPDRLGEYSHLVWFNPFYVFLDIFRSSILSLPVNTTSLKIAVYITIGSLILGITTLLLSYKNIKHRVFQQ